MYIECYLLTELLNSPSHYYSFQAYSLIAGHFVGPSEPALWLYFVYFPLCLVSAPKLRIYINSCIKTIQLYMKLILLLMLR